MTVLARLKEVVPVNMDSGTGGKVDPKEQNENGTTQPRAVMSGHEEKGNITAKVETRGLEARISPPKMNHAASAFEFVMEEHVTHPVHKNSRPPLKTSAISTAVKETVGSKARLGGRRTATHDKPPPPPSSDNVASSRATTSHSHSDTAALNHDSLHHMPAPKRPPDASHDIAAEVAGLLPEKIAEETMVAKARLVQWAFLKARADHAFEKRKEKAETQILLAWSLLQQKRAERDRLRNEINVRVRLKELLEQLGGQSVFLEAMEAVSATFRQRYSRLVAFVQTQAQQVHIKGGAITDTGKIKEIVDEAASLVSEILEERKVSLSQVSAIAQAYKELRELQDGIRAREASCEGLERTIEDASLLRQSYEVELMQLQR
ncbi:hypothetical protein BC829DRAFT_298962 [Chytridium lagenaria]|nr:hypothetical protein BC829DRAFT_298962 [Chytridium lagenaria]